MQDLLQLIVSGLALGGLYALIALGFVVIHRASQVFNFAQGEFLAFGAFLMVSLSALGLPWGIALLGSMTLTGALAAILERTFLRPLIGRPVFVTIILTIFLGFLLRSAILVFWGTTPRDMPTPWNTMGSFEFKNIILLYNPLAAIVCAAGALLLFFLVLRYTRFGVAMRATSTDQEASLSLGIPVGRIFGATWFIAGMLAALAGVFLGMFPSNVDANIGYTALSAFPAMIIGGLDSILGAVIAGLLLGVLEVLTRQYVNEALGSFGKNFHTVFPYLVMILFLIVRPYGLFGAKDVERV